MKTQVRIHTGCARKQQWAFDSFFVPSHVLTPVLGPPPAHPEMLLYQVPG